MYRERRSNKSVLCEYRHLSTDQSSAILSFGHENIVKQMLLIQICVFFHPAHNLIWTFLLMLVFAFNFICVCTYLYWISFGLASLSPLLAPGLNIWCLCSGGGGWTGREPWELWVFVTHRYLLYRHLYHHQHHHISQDLGRGWRGRELWELSVLLHSDIFFIVIFIIISTSISDKKNLDRGWTGREL